MAKAPRDTTKHAQPRGVDDRTDYFIRDSSQVGGGTIGTMATRGALDLDDDAKPSAGGMIEDVRQAVEAELDDEQGSIFDQR